MTEAQTVEDAQQQQEVGIGMADIGACVQIIDIVTKRGAFEGPELADVGIVRNRLAAFLEANAAKEEEDTESELSEED